MQALVAETNVLARVTLIRILQRAGFVVEELSDETVSVSNLYGHEPPDLAIFAVDTSIFNFEQVCEAMREARPSVYIVAVIPEARRAELTKIVSRCADDFIIIPINAREVEARIEIIRRQILRTLAETPAPATEKRGEKEHPAEEPHEGDGIVTEARFTGPTETGESVSQSLPTPDEPGTSLFVVDETSSLPGLLSGINVVETILHAFGKTETGQAQEIEADQAVNDAYYACLLPLVIQNEYGAEWVNILLEIDKLDADRLYRIYESKVVFSEQESKKLLEKVLQSIQEELVLSLRNIGALTLFTPVVPIVARSEEVPPISVLTSKKSAGIQIGISLVEGVRIRCSIAALPIPLVERSITALRSVDVLASPIQTVDEDIMLLSEGIMLKDYYIQKVKSFLHTHSLPRKVNVFRPPSGTAMFLYSHLEDL